MNRIKRAPAALSLTCMLLAACGSDAVDEPASQLPDLPGSLDMSAQPDLAPSVDMSEPEEDLRRVPQDYVQSIRFVRVYRDCDTPDCKQDVQFSMRGGMMWRYAYDMRLRSTTLEPQEYEQLRELVLGEPLLAALMASELTCPEQPGDHNVLLVVEVEDEPGIKMFDVSGCHNSDQMELVDAFIEFAMRMERKYD